MCAIAQCPTPTLILCTRLRYNHWVTRCATLVLLTFALLVGACSSTSNPADPDGGTTNPDGGEPDGGVPVVTGQCRIEGYPCSLSEVSPEARALSLQYADDVRDRLTAGDSYEEVVAWLETQDDIVDVIGDSTALRFRVEGGTAKWSYSPGPGISRPNPSALTVKSEAAATPSVPKSVLRRDGSDTSIKKKALFIEPFAEFIDTPTDTWSRELLKLHDYEQVDHPINQDVLDEHFGNWDDYRFVWVTTHGKHFPTDNPTQSLLYSSRMCEEFGWLKAEIEAGRGDEPTQGGGSTLRALFGRSRSSIEGNVTPLQRERWDEYENNEIPEAEGIDCGNLKMEWIPIPGNQPGDAPLTNVIIKYWLYDDVWFGNAFPGGLENTFVYQRACTSDKLRINVGSGEPGAVLGWTDTINSADDDKTIGVLFDRMVRNGETLEDALQDVNDVGFNTFQRDDKSPTLVVVKKGAGGEQFRIREIISIVDPETLQPFRDEGGMLDAREITAQGDTVVDITVEIAGFGELEEGELEKYKVQIFDGTGRAISGKFEAGEPDPVLWKTYMTIPVTLNQAIRSPTDVEIEARVKLPEGEDSRHPIKLTVGPAIASLWTLNVGGGGTARGDFVFAPLPVGIMDGEGRTIWQVTLAQLDDALVPTATIIIVGHNGRTPECTGQTGNFEAFATVLFTESTMPTEGFGGGLGQGGCGDFVNVDIISFSKKDDLVANVSGTICHWERVGEESVVTQVPINGRFQMPSAGCGANTGNDALGSYYATEAPFLCIDIYSNAAIAPAFDELCMMGGGLVCSEDPCPTAGQIGQCDYRDDSVNISFRGQIQHFGLGGDWPPVADLQTGCGLQLGIWTTGAPPM